ncbi:MAG: response regulator [Bryobacteraceae bacterium]|jgi:CheY-like chemotaxis protein
MRAETRIEMTSSASATPIELVAASTAFAQFLPKRFGVEFLTSLNHAIRTPMSGILGLSELLLESPLEPEHREYIVSIRSCASALNDLLASTLDYASLASGGIRLEEQDFPLVTAIEAGLREARGRALESGTVLESELAPGLDRIVRADALRLRDVVSLMSRASIHSATNGRVRFRAQLADWGPRFGELSLEVRREVVGNGSAGAAPPCSYQEPEGLLAETFRIETLEMALLQRLVGLLRGSLNVSLEAHGSIGLRVVLPIGLRDVNPREELAPAEATRPAILIADDNRISLRVLGSVLSRAGFEVLAVESGEAAVRALGTRRFDVVLLDILMPGLDGGAATARIRMLPECASIPILGITAGVTEELRESCRRSGMDAILGKPVNASELVESVRFHLVRTSS